MGHSKEYPIAIIGGGPVGLSSSILLSLRGIPHVLFERYASTSIHPKACGINQRTMEVFRVMGIEKEVQAASAPPNVAGRTAWYTGFGPDGLEIASRDSWGGGQYAAEYAKHSPSRYCILPQIRLEPILKRRALELNPHGIQYRHEVSDIEQDGSKVCLKVRVNKEDEIEVNARYVISADGGRMTAEKLGVQWEGERRIFDMVTAHIRCPLLTKLHPDAGNFMTWFTNPESGGSINTGYLYQIGPWSSDGTSEEWVFACARFQGDPTTFDHDTMAVRLRKTLRLPDLSFETLSLSPWYVDAISTDRYRLGRVFLVGDAAHRIPPWGALGMNTGIQDAQNLVWKLVLALQDSARYDALLSTYDEERLPIGRRVGKWSLHNLRSHGLDMDAALGMSPTQTTEENKRGIAPFFDATHPDHDKSRMAVDDAQKTLDSEFKAPGVEIGWFYPSADLNHEGGKTHGGQLRDDGELDALVYKPVTIPGHHLPHAWLQKDGQRLALRDLIPLDKFLLLAQVQEWNNHESELVHVEIVGKEGWNDIDGEWTQVRGVSETGAVLVRPDGIVAWRGELGDVQGDRWPVLIERILRH